MKPTNKKSPFVSEVCPEGPTIKKSPSSPSGATGVFTEATECGFGPTKERQSPLPTEEGLGRGLRLALFSGSFDPFTLGHADIVRRALTFCDEVVVAVGYNERKAGWLPVEERVARLQQLYADEPRVRVASYQGLTVDFAKTCGATALIRGVRTMADFEYEMQMADVNRQLSGIETILLPASPQLASLSSSVVRELAHFGRDITEYLP